MENVKFNYFVETSIKCNNDAIRLHNSLSELQSQLQEPEHRNEYLSCWKSLKDVKIILNRLAEMDSKSPF